MAKVMTVGEQTVTLGIWVSAGARGAPLTSLTTSWLRDSRDLLTPVTSRVLPCRPQDTAGSERYEAMSRIYYRGARAAVVCYGKGTENGKTKEWRLQRCRVGVVGTAVGRALSSSVSRP